MGWNGGPSFAANVNGGKPFDLKITSENLPSHTHTFSYQKYTGNHDFSEPDGAGIKVPDFNVTEDIPGTTGSTGGNTSISIPIGDYINNFPVVYIMYVGTKTGAACTDKML